MVCFCFLSNVLKANDTAFLAERINYHTIYKKVLNKQKREALSKKKREENLALQKIKDDQFSSKTFLEKIAFIWSRYIWGSAGRPELGVMVVDKAGRVIATHPSNALRFMVMDENGDIKNYLQPVGRF